jgi:hypothetical protein
VLPLAVAPVAIDVVKELVDEVPILIGPVELVSAEPIFNVPLVKPVVILTVPVVMVDQRAGVPEAEEAEIVSITGVVSVLLVSVWLPVSVAY